MRANDGSRSGGEVLVDQLIAHGVRHVFCVPGESYLAALDAFYDRDIAVTTCRQEGGAAIMAEAVGKFTGRPGVCFTTRGPGATNAAHGIHIARQDSTPLVMFVGQVGREMPDRVVVADAPPFEPVETWPGLSDMARLQKLLWEAARPIMLLGGSRWSETATAAVMRFAERCALPVATTFRRGHLFDALHPCYAGDLGIGPNPKLLARIKAADLVILVGGRLGEMPSQSYTLFDIPGPRQTLVHVHPGAEELGRVYRPHLAINAAPTAFAAALEGVQPPNEIRWRADSGTAHEEYLAWTQTPTQQPGAVNLGEVMVWLREHLPPDAILCSGAGNFAAWIHRFYRFRRFATHVAPTSGSMGYGVPAAVAMKRINQQRTVICIAGDGDFLMNGQEFATAVQHDLPFVVVLADNRIYGTIRMHQEREYPGRTIATDLKNPDFVAYARAFGGFGIAVERPPISVRLTRRRSNPASPPSCT